LGKPRYLEVLFRGKSIETYIRNPGCVNRSWFSQSDSGKITTWEQYVENAQRAHSPQLAAGNASEYWYYQKVLTFGRFPADCFRELQLKEISHYLARPVMKFGPWLGI